MSQWQKFVCRGNLTRDSELRFTATGTAVLGMRIATGRVYFVDKEKREDKLFLDASLFGKRAESMHGALTKGSPVVLEGHLKEVSWEREGKMTSRITMVVSEIELVERRGPAPQVNEPAEEAPRGKAEWKKPVPQKRAPEPEDPGYGDSPDDSVDELPF